MSAQHTPPMFTLIRGGKNPAYAYVIGRNLDQVTLGTVFCNWQGWCWCRWSQPIFGLPDPNNNISVCVGDTPREEGVCASEAQARRELIAALAKVRK